jgi:hypothetical protein
LVHAIETTIVTQNPQQVSVSLAPLSSTSGSFTLIVSGGRSTRIGG